MKKNLMKVLSVTLMLAMVLCLTACDMLPFGGRDFVEGSDEAQQTTTTKAPEKMTGSELDAAISKQEVRVVSTEYVVQSKDYKVLYPDMLQAVFQNDSSYDLKNVVIAFVAWDENDLPVEIEGKYDFLGGEYLQECSYSGINLLAGKKYGEDSGMELAEGMDIIKKVKAIVVSYEPFDGEIWENPLYDEWVEMYEGNRYRE